MQKTSAYITEAEARELQQNWIKTRAADIKIGRGKEDVREFLFSVEELQNYLNYIKEKSTSNNPGVRIYLAAYSDKANSEATIFLAPTKGVLPDSENDYDIQPINKAVNGWPPRNY